MNRTEKKIDFAHLPNKVKSNWVASVLLLLLHVVYWMVNTRQLHFNGKLCTINQQFGYNAFATAKANNKWNFSIRWQTMSENGFGVCVCMVLASTLMKNTCDGISLRSIFRLSIDALQHFSLSSLQTQHFSNDAFHVFDCKNVVGGGRWIVNGKTDELSKNNWPLYRNFILLRIGNNHPFDVEEIAGWISENWKWRSRSYSVAFVNWKLAKRKNLKLLCRYEKHARILWVDWTTGSLIRLKQFAHEMNDGKKLRPPKQSN